MSKFVWRNKHPKHKYSESEQYEDSVENKKERIKIADPFPLPPPPPPDIWISVLKNNF